MARRPRHGDDGGDVEFLAPDPGAFGHVGGTWSGEPRSTTPDSAGDEPTTEVAPARRAGVFATVGLLAVVAAATVAVVPWGDSGRRTSTSISTPPTTATPASSASTPTTQDPTDGAIASTPPTTRDPGFVLTPPSDMRLAGSSQVEPGDDVQQLEGWGEVWAAPGSTRTSGRWTAVTIAPFGWGLYIVPDAIRVAVEGRVGVLSTAADGVSTLVVATDFERDDRLLRIEAWGWTIDELVELAASIGLESDRPQLVDDRPLYRDPSLLDGLVLLSARSADWDPVRTAYVASATAITGYADPTEDRWLWLARVDTDRLDKTVSLGFTPSDLTVDAVLSRASSLPDDLRLGATVDGSIAWWTDQESGERLLAVSNLAPSELQALIPSARQATADEWEAALRMPFVGEPRRDPEPQLLAGEGTLAAGAEWRVVVDPVSSTARFEAGLTESTVVVFTDPDDRIGRLARPDLGLVVVRRPGPGTVRVTTIDGVIEQPFSDATAVVVDAFGPLSVDVLDATGQVVASE